MLPNVSVIFLYVSSTKGELDGCVVLVSVWMVLVLDVVEVEDGVVDEVEGRWELVLELDDVLGHIDIDDDAHVDTNVARAPMMSL
mmetsp:Transcript_45899/g.102976  ORF Transcript_45899/g.102976 Transcript_45899/m.102976 type:complete len:85 (+) Transcript_45899:768-1022(+)